GLGRHNLSCICDIDKIFDSSGEHGECHLHAVLNSALQLLETADAADKVNAVVGSGIADTEYGAEKVFLKNGDIKTLDRVALVECACLSCQDIPFAADEHTELVLCVGTVLSFAVKGSYIELVFDSCKELCLCETVEVCYNAVVVHDVELLVGEEDREEEVELLIACKVGVLSAALSADAYSRCTSVVTVCNVEIFCVGKLFGDSVDIGFVVDDPSCVAYAVFCYEVIYGSLFHGLCHDLIDNRASLVGEEDGACV